METRLYPVENPSIVTFSEPNFWEPVFYPWGTHLLPVVTRRKKMGSGLHGQSGDLAFDRCRIARNRKMILQSVLLIALYMW